MKLFFKVELQIELNTPCMIKFMHICYYILKMREALERRSPNIVVQL